MSFTLTHAPIDPAALTEALRDNGAGACVTFEGRVRDRNEGRLVRSLEYEAYSPLAEEEGARILSEAQGKFGIARARCVHRTGTLALGEISVWVAVTAEHRAAAFEACLYIIDQVKCRVPIWKKEHYAEGASGWIGTGGANPGPPR